MKAMILFLIMILGNIKPGMSMTDEKESADPTKPRMTIVTNEKEEGGVPPHLQEGKRSPAAGGSPPTSPRSATIGKIGGNRKVIYDSLPDLVKNLIYNGLPDPVKKKISLEDFANVAEGNHNPLFNSMIFIEEFFGYNKINNINFNCSEEDIIFWYKNIIKYFELSESAKQEVFFWKSCAEFINEEFDKYLNISNEKFPEQRLEGLEEDFVILPEGSPLAQLIAQEKKYEDCILDVAALLRLYLDAHTKKVKKSDVENLKQLDHYVLAAYLRDVLSKKFEQRYADLFMEGGLNHVVRYKALESVLRAIPPHLALEIILASFREDSEKNSEGNTKTN